MSEGEEAEFWLDTTRIHSFDAESGENLLTSRDQVPDLPRPPDDALEPIGGKARE